MEQGDTLYVIDMGPAHSKLLVVLRSENIKLNQLNYFKVECFSETKSFTVMKVGHACVWGTVGKSVMKLERGAEQIDFKPSTKGDNMCQQT